MGFPEILTVVFVVLKMIGVIGWSWWLVLLPEIIGVVFYALCFFVAIVFDANANQKKYGRNRNA